MSLYWTINPLGLSRFCYISPIFGVFDWYLLDKHSIVLIARPPKALININFNVQDVICSFVTVSYK